ncbi:MAG: hypothetical protein ACXAEI_09175 [Candidatus Hodarchaeales archaeon]|jgi:hypothetical protein
MQHPKLDDFTEHYLRLALQLDRHIEGYVDAYFGPPELKTQVLSEDLPSPKVLSKSINQLLYRLEEVDYDQRRTAYLQKQVAAIETTIKKLNGEKLNFIEEVEGCFDIRPEKAEEDSFLAALEALDEYLPGKGAITDRNDAYQKQFEIPQKQLPQILDLATEEVRQRSKTTIVSSELPENENMDIFTVTERPWSAYNWYLGQSQSKIEVNVDRPMDSLRILNLMAHECYPGHHTEHAIKEHLLYYQAGYGENAALLTLAPESLISEGIANYGRDLLFSRREALEWTAAQIFPLLPKQPVFDIETHLKILEANQAFDGLSSHIALLLYVDGCTKEEVVEFASKHSASTEERIQASLKFIQHPLWRSYVFNYFYGEIMVRQWCEKGDRERRFQELLRKQFWPSLLKSS